MNAVRSAMSAFMVSVLVFSFLGWRWSVALPSPKLEGARLVLALAALAALAGLGIIWKAKPEKSP